MRYFAWIDGECKKSWVIIGHGREIVERLEADIAMLQGPFVIRLEKNCADQSQDRCFVGEDADNVSATFHLTVQAFQCVRECNFVRCALGKVM